MKYLGEERDLRVLGKKFSEKLSKIKACAFDIDGVLTDGRLYWDGNEVGFNRFFHSSDGYGLKLLMKFGLKVGVISGGDSVGVRKRFEENLNLDFAYLGNEDKREAYKDLKKKFNLEDEEILYMGDELFDIPLLERAGFAVTVPGASYEVHEVADYITLRESGKACVREVIDILRYSRGFYPDIPKI